MYRAQLARYNDFDIDIAVFEFLAGGWDRVSRIFLLCPTPHAPCDAFPQKTKKKLVARVLIIGVPIGGAVLANAMLAKSTTTGPSIIDSGTSSLMCVSLRARA